MPILYQKRKNMSRKIYGASATKAAPTFKVPSFVPGLALSAYFIGKVSDMVYVGLAPRNIRAHGSCSAIKFSGNLGFSPIEPGYQKEFAQNAIPRGIINIATRTYFNPESVIV